MAALPFKVKSVYEYTSEHDDDLHFPIGQVITVTELEGDDWYVGEYTDANGDKHDGLFPANFVEKYEPEVPTRPTRPVRQKQEVPQAGTAPPEEHEQDAPPSLPVASKPSSQPAELEPRSPTSTANQPLPSARRETPTVSSPPPVEPAESASASTKKPPPPVAAKSNAFKDRIAAFNQPAAAPLAPMQPGGKSSGFIKKPFIAPPPSKNAYVPAPKVEPVHKPYVREEDPEIRQRQEEDRAAAEAAGLTSESSAPVQAEDEEDAPKPMTLKERMALLQKQQQEQAQRRAETTQKKEKKVPQKQLSGSSDQGAAHEPDSDQLDRITSGGTERQSMDAPREKRRVASTQRDVEPIPAPAEHEIISDGHEADQSGAGEASETDTGTLGPDDSDDRGVESMRHPTAPRTAPDVGEEDGATERQEGDEDEEEEDEVDEETRRKEELRARMARLGGGMPGMGAPFNPFGAPPPAPPRKKQSSRDTQPPEDAAPPPQRVAMVPVPGMQRIHSPDSDTTQRVPLRDEDEEDEEAAPQPPRRSSTMERGAPPVPKDSRPVPPPPQERAVPPPPPSSARPVPPPPPAVAPNSPGPGSESEDDMPSHADGASADTAQTPLPIRTGAPPVPARDLPPRPPPSSDSRRSGNFESNDTTYDKRSSRVPPPIPVGSPVTSPRPPPPPPPTQDYREDERVGSDYDGDYDTDIASSAKHKDALKAPHVREASLTDNLPVDESPVSAPQASAPRAVPPPPPDSAPRSRPSMDRPPPPLPPSRDVPEDDHEYDPYRHTGGARAVPPIPTGAPASAPPMPPQQEPTAEESSEEDLYAPPTRQSMDRAPPRPPQERAVPPPPDQRSAPPPPSQEPPQVQPPSRASTDMFRSSARRSTEQSRPSGEHGQIAGDLTLPTDGGPWWTAERPLPPALQQRNGVDVLSECEETSKSKRGGKKEITKDIYILYMDYSQTVISARYDEQDLADVNFEQRHESPPQRMRQDQLEAAWHRFGTKIADAAGQLGHSKKDSHAADGSPQSLPLALIQAQQDALLPVGTRAYGALVYANLANASTMQYDEIRRGDIITVRNAKFEGHHGAMKTKYKTDYGASHVAVVEEWDGTKRAVRAWEQGREKKGGVRSEKFRLGDLRSGEVRVWRVVARDWVGWET